MLRIPHCPDNRLTDSPETLFSLIRALSNSNMEYIIFSPRLVVIYFNELIFDYPVMRAGVIDRACPYSSLP
jgi:hypothetical protein